MILKYEGNTKVLRMSSKTHILKSFYMSLMLCLFCVGFLHPKTPFRNTHTNMLVCKYGYLIFALGLHNWVRAGFALGTANNFKYV